MYCSAASIKLVISQTREINNLVSVYDRLNQDHYIQPDASVARHISNLGDLIRYLRNELMNTIRVECNAPEDIIERVTSILLDSCPVYSPDDGLSDDDDDSPDETPIQDDIDSFMEAFNEIEQQYRYC